MSKHHYRNDPNRKREAEKYQSPVPSREHILEYIKDMGKPCSYEKIAKDLGLHEEQMDGLRFRLKAMLRDGQLMQDHKRAYMPFEAQDLIPGKISRTKDGNGFLLSTDGSSDIFIPAKYMHNVYGQDEVLLQVMGKGRNKTRREGKIIKVTKRNMTELAGQCVIENDRYYCRPDSSQIDILIPFKAPEGMDVEPGDVIVIKVHYEHLYRPRTQMTGTLKEVLGDRFTPGLEIDLAIRAHQLPYEWPEAVLQQADAIPDELQKEEYEHRTDCRDLDFVTIDGADARDYDDAVYAKQTDKGWKLFVAIADASHYVQKDTPLDDEAVNRGNSVYFPNRVIPMLPEKLSNGLCSLKPEVDRLALMCEMHLDKDANVIDYNVYETVIHSKARLTYDEVYAHMENKTPLQGSYTKSLAALTHLYTALLKKRRKRGALEFDTPEPVMSFNDQAKIIDITLRTRNDAHRLIEEMMLLANTTLGIYVANHKLDILWRNHCPPDENDLEQLRNFLKMYGLKLGGHNDITPLDYAHLLESITGRKDVKLIESVILRSMKQATYEGSNQGHFGLAFDHYTHFTSPIRRYPDLYLHRVIKQYLKFKREKKKYKPLDDAQLQELHALGDHCSMTERRADKATREAITWLKCDYMQDKVGQQFAGAITEVTNFGLFIILKDIFIEGLIHITTLPEDYYHYDNKTHTLVGKHGGRQFKLGDNIEVRVDRVDMDKRRIELGLV